MGTVKNRILLVDDEPTNIFILEHILEKEGYVLKSVDSGEKALEVIEDFTPDIVLLDVMMPGMDGYEVCRRMCQDEKLRFTKKILVSAKAMLPERLKGYENGGDDYITKPFDDKELLAKVKVFLNLKFTEDIDNLKSKIFGLIFQEIRGPLNNILGYSSLLNKSHNLQEIEREYLTAIAQAGGQLDDLAQKALLLSEIKLGLKLVLTSFSMEEVINKVIKKFYEKSIEKQIVLIFDSRQTENFCFDRVLVEHAINFILEDVIKFSPVCSEVIISLKALDENCIIEVKVCGEAVAKNYMPKIFEKFIFDGSESVQQGDCLSLALAKNIMRLHGGTLSVFSNSDKRVNFIFSLPMK